MTYALNSKERIYQTSCSHTHSQRCESCVAVDEVLLRVQEVTQEKEWENADAVHFKVVSLK